MEKTEIQPNVRYKFKVYDLKNKKALTRAEIFTIFKRQWSRI